MARYKILGIGDDVTDCQCCGKSDLKATVALKVIDSGEVVRYGRTCAAVAMNAANGLGRLTGAKVEKLAVNAGYDPLRMRTLTIAEMAAAEGGAR